MNVDILLQEEVTREFEKLKDLEIGTEAYKTTIEGLTKLMDRGIEIDKSNREHAENVEAREIETFFKAQQVSDENIDRWIKNGLTAVSIVGGFALTVWGTIKTIKFEETGTVTTIMGRGFFNKLLPKK